MTKLKKWQLLQTEDISPSSHFPLEKRTYKLPNGKVVNDFYVTTIADSVHIIPITPDGNVVMIRMYKPGIDQFVTQFPAGRFEASKHKDKTDTAAQELEEETGIKVDPSQLQYLGKQAVMTTKSSEYAHVYIATHVKFNSQQKLDDYEEIDVIVVSPDDIDLMIEEGEIIEGLTIADWYLVKSKFPQLLDL